MSTIPALVANAVLVLSTSALAMTETEPNNTFATADDASQWHKIAGTIEPDTFNGGSFDVFKIHRFISFPFRVTAEARIVSGPFAGSESFRFAFVPNSVPPYTNPHHPISGRPTGSGSRRIHYESFPVLAPGYLTLEFEPTISSGEYEIIFSLVPSESRSLHAPTISIDHTSRNRREAKVEITVSSGSNDLMHRVFAKADGNRAASIVSNYFGTQYRNTEEGRNYLSASDFEMTYTFAVRRRTTRLRILAEDSSGFISRKTLTFHRKAPARILGPVAHGYPMRPMRRY